MTILRAAVISMIAMHVLQAIIYGAVLHHNFHGSKYSFVKHVTLLLLTYALVAIFYNCLELINISSPSVFLRQIEFLSFGVSSACFAVAHWLLAEKYSNVAKDIPYIIDGNSPPDDKCCSKETKKNFVTILNVIMNLAREVIRIILSAESQPNNGVVTAYIIIQWAQACLVLYSGILLLWSVIYIRKFLLNMD
jgi:hypothetical protein